VVLLHYLSSHAAPKDMGPERRCDDWPNKKRDKKGQKVPKFDVGSSPERYMVDQRTPNKIREGGERHENHAQMSLSRGQGGDEKIAFNIIARRFRSANGGA